MKLHGILSRAAISLLAPLAMGGAAPLLAQDEPAQAEEQQAAPAPPRNAQIFDAEIVAEYPHDPAAFTQGLLFHDGFLYESTGRLGTSSVRRVDLETGQVLAASDLPDDQFGEGLTVWNNQLISLTWKNGIVHRWNLDENLTPISSYGVLPFEFWGLTTFEDQLVFSDGTDTLRFVDPESFEIEREIQVTFLGAPLIDINELEVMGGLIWANLWFSRDIIGIDPATGEVVQAASLSAVTDRITPVEDGAVLNGIAYDAENDRLFVTGKLWPSLFEIRLVPREPLLEFAAQSAPLPAHASAD